MTDPLDKPRKLARRVSDVAGKLGLEVVGFGVVPDPTGEDDYVEVTFRVTPEAFQTQEQRDMDAQFYDLLAGFEDDEPSELDDIKQNLKDWDL